MLTGTEKAQLESEVTSIVGTDAVGRAGRAVIHPFFATIEVAPTGAASGYESYNLRVVSWGDGSGVPASGQSLVIVGIDNNSLLHVRIFDSSGKLVTDADETQLPPAQAEPIVKLKQQLAGLLNHGVVTPDEQAQVISQATAIVGQSRGDQFAFAPVLFDKHYGLYLLPDGLSRGVVSNSTITLGDLVPNSGIGLYPGDVSWVRLFARQLESLTRDTFDFPDAAPFLLQYSNEDFPDGVNFSIVPQVNPPDPYSGKPIIQDETIPLGDSTIAFDYVQVNSLGWISNIAKVSIDVNLSDEVNRVAVPVISSSSPIVFAAPPNTYLLVSDAQIPDNLPIPGNVKLISRELFSITVSNVPVGAMTTVTLTLPADLDIVSTYFKFDRLNNTFYQFVKGTGTAGLGAVFSHDPMTGQEIITLHLQDGGWGDDDGVANAQIVDPGILAVYANPAQNYVASVYEDVLGRAPSAAESAYWVKQVDRGALRVKLADSVWNSAEHRRMQVAQWSSDLLGHPAGPLATARWVKLLRRGKGETAVELRILTSPAYHRSHPTLASFVAGIKHDVLGYPTNPVKASSERLRRESKTVGRAELALSLLTSRAAAARLAQQNGTTFLGRRATTREDHAAAPAPPAKPVSPDPNR